MPATLILIVLSICGFLLFYLQAPVSWLSHLTFSDFRVVDGRPEFLPTSGEYWRLLTPIFLHFGWLHIVFNCLWLWELGALIELRLGTIVLLLLVLSSGIGSNYAQFLDSGPSLFGGMSGVVYALLGVCWVYNSLRPQGGLAVPRVGPVTATVLGSVFLSEATSPAFLLGLACVVLGLWLAHRRPPPSGGT